MSNNNLVDLAEEMRFSQGDRKVVEPHLKQFMKIQTYQFQDYFEYNLGEDGEVTVHCTDVDELFERVSVQRGHQLAEFIKVV